MSLPRPSSAWAAAAVLLAAGHLAAPLRGQQSAGYKLEEQVLNLAGHPADSGILSSGTFRLQLDALGESATALGPASASFVMTAGFGSAYPPPGEVRNLRFLDPSTLEWDAEPSAGDFNLYRGLTTDLASGGSGTCLQSGMTTTSAADESIPAVGTAYFYFVTVENLLDEEGIRGFDSSGHERPDGAPCP